jgi:hypothetical protein
MRPVPFLVGLLAGLLGCAVAGRIAASVTSFEYFNRFFIFIQPQTQFFPTMSQLLATAKLKTAPEKTLVVIGSSSIFRGTGQNPDDLWSRELQRLLGDDFAVLNYAIDEAAMTSFGAAAFRALRQIYPKGRFRCAREPVALRSDRRGRALPLFVLGRLVQRPAAARR